MVKSKTTKGSRVVSAEDFLKKLSSLRTERSVRAYLNDTLYGVISEDSCGLETKDVYKSKVDINWDLFYEVLNTENRFGIHEHFGSAFCLVNLMKPKIVAMFNERTKGITSRGDISDFFQSSWLTLAGLMEKTVDEKGKAHGYDPEVTGNNILPYTQSNLRTALNDVLKPEITKHIAQTYGYSTCSLDGLLENEDNSFEAPDTPLELLDEIDDTKNELYAPEFRNMTVEDFCVAKIMSESSCKELAKVIASEEFSTVQKIKTVYTDGKLELSEEEYEEMEAIDDAEDLEHDEETGEKEAV